MVDKTKLQALEDYLWANTSVKGKRNRVRGNGPLAQIMRIRGWRDADLAAAADVPLYHIQRLRFLRADALRTPVETIIRLAIFLQITPVTLFPQLAAKPKQQRKRRRKVLRAAQEDAARKAERAKRAASNQT